MARELDVVAERLRSDGAGPYIIPGGGSNRTGALGYVSCPFELMS
jgi:L-cysteate sulfo-lyase